MVGRYHVCSILHSRSPNPHYESGASHVTRDSEMAVMKINPFTVETTNVVNI